jgi:hypothetical protein
MRQQLTPNDNRRTVVDLNNAAIDGGYDRQNTESADLAITVRKTVKVVRVSERADASNTIGGNERSVTRRRNGKRNQRYLEGISLTAQASVADDGSAVANGAFAFLVTNIDAGATAPYRLRTSTR